MKKLILLGYMGSGKSTIAKLVSNKLQLPYKDLDLCIEEQEQMSVSAIFETKGEIYFRKKEHLVFKELMASEESFVLSLGGGTPCYANNHLLLNGEGIMSVYLKTSLEDLYQRLKSEKDTRPLLFHKSPEELKEFIAQHLFERSFYYNQATVTLNTEGKSPQEIVAEIQNLLV
jgi:shikimate kinase